MDDVVLAKAAVIERCIGRVREEHGGDDSHLTDDLRRQDSIILNLQRACEASIDLAMHLVRKERLGIPQDSREAFDLLAGANMSTPSWPRASSAWWASATSRCTTTRASISTSSARSSRSVSAISAASRANASGAMRGSTSASLLERRRLRACARG